DAYQAGEKEMLLGVPLQNLVEQGLAFYDPVELSEPTRSTSVPAGQRRNVAISQPAEPGEYLVTYTFHSVSASDAPLAQGPTTLRIDAPLALTLEPYWLNAQVLKASADLRKIGAIGEGVQAEFTLLAREGEN